MPINWKRNLFFIWLGQLLALCGDAFALPFMPLYIRDNFGIVDETVRGGIVAAYQFFGTMTFCISNPLWGMFGDRYGRKLMLLRAYFLNGITIPLLMFAPTWGWLIALRALVNCFSGTVSASQTLVLTTTPEEHHGFALGVLSTALWSGTVLGLLGGGVIVQYFSYRTAFFTCGAMFLFSGVLMLLFVRENFVRPAKKTGGAGKMRLRLSGKIPALLLFIGAVALARRMDVPFLPM
ncbi:MAG: MFS transporter, partial [Lentisphaeria bacterium]|nr:MFS transporter [Lentisphaeria bacterium]